MTGSWLRLAGLLLLLQSSMAFGAGEPPAPEIVLQLPAGTDIAQIRTILSDLRDKGAFVRGQADTSGTEASLADQIWARLREAAPKAGLLLTLPDRWRSAADPSRTGRFFWLRLAGLIAVALSLERLARSTSRRLFPILPNSADTALHAAFVRHFVSLALGLAAFIATVRIGGGFLGPGSSLATITESDFIDSSITWRTAIAILQLFVSPGMGSARPLHFDDVGARVVARWIGAYLLYDMLFVPSIRLVGRLGDADLVLDMAVGFGVLVTAYRVTMFLRLRRTVASSILMAGGETPSPLRRFVAASWHWVFIALSFLIIGLALEQYAIGYNTAAGGAAAALQTGLVGMAFAWGSKERFLIEYSPGSGGGPWRQVVSRLIDLVMILGGLAWLSSLWGYDIFDPAQAGVTDTILRPAFRAAATLAVAWLVWSAIGSLLRDRRRSDGAQDEDGLNGDGVTRLATLLPFLRTCLAIAIFFFAAALALRDLGIDVGPLLAGAGVVGIALGFGAQTLVRDVIAGLFFLIDDAFRIGEYIDTGKLKGTVEAISIRSVRLRHQTGLLHTIPFGQIAAVTNGSRDGTIVKFNLHIAPTSDLELVRKTIKQLGLALLDDPEIGGDFIAPLKMQGVMDVTHGAIMIRCKFTAKPLRPSFLRRQAMREIIAKFAAVGVAFAAPPQTASNPR